MHWALQSPSSQPLNANLWYAPGMCGVAVERELSEIARNRTEDRPVTQISIADVYCYNVMTGLWDYLKQFICRYSMVFEAI